MSEVERQQARSPLVSERGVTTIKDSVVSRIAGMAAREVEGVHMGGSTSRTAGEVLGNITGSDSQTRGISVSVGQIEVAIDLTMGIDYGRNFLETVEEVRRRITERVEGITGLRVVECNATISDVIFPDDGRRGELESGTEPGAREPGYTETGPTSRTHEESRSGPVDEDETAAEDETREFERGPLADDETERGARREGS